MSLTYDSMGMNYAELRKPDPRIARFITHALGDASTVLNVGAGTGSYEPADRQVTAVEPSREMIRQRKPGAVPAIEACAESLPFPDKSFDASMAILTIHHWTDKRAGLREMRRVTRGPVVLLSFDPSSRPWLTDYLPELAVLDDERMPTLVELEQWLGPLQVTPVPIPHDCTDGFLYAYWKRPFAYLDTRLRAGSSSFWLIKGVEEGLEELKRDLKSGAWERRYADLLQQDEYEAGYRLVVAN
ncbi:MAG: class I SAM-dependent methyltransferase [Alphaproteobacteria bacterium]